MENLTIKQTIDRINQVLKQQKETISVVSKGITARISPEKSHKTISATLSDKDMGFPKADNGAQVRALAIRKMQAILSEDDRKADDGAAILSENEMAVLQADDGAEIHALALRKMGGCAKEKQAMFDLMFAMVAMMHGDELKVRKVEKLKVHKRPQDDLPAPAAPATVSPVSGLGMVAMVATAVVAPAMMAVVATAAVAAAPVMMETAAVAVMHGKDQLRKVSKAQKQPKDNEDLDALPPDIQQLRKEMSAERKQAALKSSKLKKMMSTMSRKEQEIDEDHKDDVPAPAAPATVPPVSWMAKAAKVATAVVVGAVVAPVVVVGTFAAVAVAPVAIGVAAAVAPVAIGVAAAAAPVAIGVTSAAAMMQPATVSPVADFGKARNGKGLEQ